MHPTTPESPARAAVRALRADEWAAYFADLERRKRAHITTMAEMVCEDLQRRIRAMEVAEAPRRPVEVLTPYTAPSDIGRTWK